MKPTVAALVLLGAGLTLSACGDPTGADGTQGASPRPEQVAAATWTPVTSCGTNITSPGEYQLTRDLVDCVGLAPISVSSNDVILKLNGHRIGLSKYRLNPRNGIQGGGLNVQILGPGFLDHFSVPISVSMTHGAIRGVTVRSYGDLGMEISGSDLRLQLNVIKGNNYATVRLNGADILFAHNQLYGGEHAMQIGGDRITVLDNTIGAGTVIAPYIGIEILSGTQNVISRNRVRLSGVTGVWIRSGSTGNQVIRNILPGNDMVDDNPCGANSWMENHFRTGYPDCLH